MSFNVFQRDASIYLSISLCARKEAYNNSNGKAVVGEDLAIEVVVNKWAENNEGHSLNWCCLAQKLE